MLEQINNFIKKYELNLELTPEKLLKINKYISIYEKWNAKINISSIKERDEIFEKHFLDSFILGRFIKKGTVVDIGSGGGFPGVAFAILRENIYLKSIEKNRKKISFQKQAAAELNLRNIEFLNYKVEDFEPRNIDYYVFRAVEENAKILAWLEKKAEKSKIIYMASSKYDLSKIEKSFNIKEVFSYELPKSLKIQRLIVFVK